MKPLSVVNVICKYADDTNLLVPEHTDVGMESEVTNITSWSKKNKLLINWKKTKEIVFHRPRFDRRLLPAQIPDIERLDFVRLLGYTMASTLSPAVHANSVISVVNQRLYLLLQLKRQGLPIESLTIVFNAIVLSRVLYALPAFYGHLNIADRERLNAFFKKAFRWAVVNCVYNFDSLANTAETRLFRQILSNTDHCLRPLLPPEKQSWYNMRQRAHSFVLPVAKTTAFKSSFIVQS